LLKLAGCGRIIAVDLVQDKLKLAKKFGADECLKADEGDAPAEIFKLTGNRGADVAFEVVGIGATLQAAIACLKKGGALTMVGNLRPTVEFPMQAVVTRQLSLFGSCSSAGEYPACLDLIASGKVDVDSFISAVVPLAEGAAWFDRLYAAEPGLMKVILKP
jgi:L-iditol 2-dehydrogenase